MAQQLRDGVELRSEKHPTKPAIVELLGDYQLRLTISEGRYHQVKRMLAAVGNQVVSLHREQIGQLRLDESLALGEYRLLSEEEVALF
jgi:16S rRNA pseudouridine516 synthase